MKKILQQEEINIEELVYDALKVRIGDAINYQELHSMIGDVIQDRRTEFEKLMNKCLDKVFVDKGFQDVIVEEFRHKVAKNLVGKLEGAIDKNIQKFRQDPVMNSKMILAIEKIINDSESI